LAKRTQKTDPRSQLSAQLIYERWLETNALQDPRAQFLCGAMADAHELNPEEVTRCILDACAMLPSDAFENDQQRSEACRRLELYVAMRRLAKAELTPKLVEAGMSEADAIRVALHIGGEHLYALRLSQGSGITRELVQFSEALVALLEAYERLGPVAEVVARKAIRLAATGAPEVNATMNAVKALSASLSAIVPAQEKRGRRPLEMLRIAISGSARAWLVGTGCWPEATVKADEGATAPLFHFYARHAGQVVSKDVFQSALLDAKAEWDRLIQRESAK
jgi:hypothetical protein